MMAFAWYCVSCSRKQQEQQQYELFLRFINRDIELQKAVSPRYPPGHTYYRRLKFGISLLDLLQKTEPHKDIIYSPHSVYQAILLSYFGTAGETQWELNEILGLDLAKSKADVASSYQLDAQTNRFQNGTIEFNSATKLYISKNIEIE